ncbi:MAG: hypothetical protein H6710_22350 [Myxococcales bacterium]|nr:hypothetical protein [Myxococcales bacterium]
MTRSKFSTLLCLGFLLSACTSDDTATSDTAGTDSDTDGTSTSTTGVSTTSTTITTSSTSGTTTAAETETGTPTSSTTAVATDTTNPTTTGPECTVNEDCGQDEMCDNGMCVPKVSTLCERLGFMDGINLLNTDFVGKVLLDQNINAYFLNNDVDGVNLISCLDKQIGEAAGCPDVVYDCMDMLTAHQGMGIGTQDFADLATDYSLALDDHQTNNAPDLTDADKTTILDTLAAMAPDIVEDADNNLTVYQRVGRKPAVLALVGNVGEAGSFIDNVANDVMINNFFLNADTTRLNTCLTRQVGGIDGPAVYGGEVDSPGAGVDEGVGVGNECMDMCTSHAGMVDDQNEPIMIEDFSALVQDLVTAMDAFAVDPADQQMILDVLGPMCTSIVASPYDCPGIATQTIEVSLEGINKQYPNDGNLYDGTLGTMDCVDLVVDDPGDNFTNVYDVAVEVGVDATWAGDVVMKLVAPDDTVLTMLSRPGLNENADNGTGCCGTSANLESTSPLTFKDGNPNDAETMGMGQASSFVICKDDAKCDYFPNPGKGIGTSFAADFRGKSVIGTWKFCIADASGGDLTTLQTVKATFDVSEPVGCN